MNTKKLFTLFSLGLTYFTWVVPAFAQTEKWEEYAPGCIVNGVARLTCIPAVIHLVINFAWIASGIVAVIFIIYAGARYVTSAGDQKKIDSARKTLNWAIIGLVIILGSYIIVNLIGYLTGTTDCISNIGFNNEECK